MPIKMDSETKPVNILVIGDLILDEYIWGTCERISPEAPVPVINVNKISHMLGGAGNVIKNLIALDANVKILGVIGNDATGQVIKNLFREVNVDTDNLIVEADRLTTKKTRVLAVKQQIVRYDNESTHDITAETQLKLVNNLLASINDTDLILISDYNKGLLTEDFLQEIIGLANKFNVKTIVDPKGRSYGKYRGAYLLKPNKKEAELATDKKISNEQSLSEVGMQLKNNLSLNYVVITLSEDGMAIFGDHYTKIPTKAQEIFDVTGAGDTVLACLGYCTAKGYVIEKACEFANHAAAIVVSKIGTATATLNEINNHIRDNQ